jgi:hypothetical protein
MFNLRDIFQLANKSLNDSAFSYQQSVAQRHQTLFHIAFEFGNNLDTDAIQREFGIRVFAPFSSRQQLKPS